jgi:hypothetical protein
MGALFGASFASVQVEPEGAPEGTLAVTRGERIRFARGAYRPHTADGRRLLAHELAHVLQQRARRVRGEGLVHSRALETEADAAGAAASEGKPVHIDAPPMPAFSSAGPIQPAIRLTGNGNTRATNLVRLNGLLAGSNTTAVAGNNGVVTINTNNGAVADATHNGYRLVSRVVAHGGEVRIGFDHQRGNVARGSEFVHDSMFIHMNTANMPTRETVRDANGDLVRQAVNPSVILGHELAHADRRMRGANARQDLGHYVQVAGNVGGGLPAFNQQEWINSEEAQTVGHVAGNADDITENQIRDSLGILPRIGYSLDPRLAMAHGLDQRMAQHQHAATQALAAANGHGQHAAWHGAQLPGHVADYNHFTGLAAQADTEAQGHQQQRDFHGQRLIDPATPPAHLGPHGTQMTYFGWQMVAAQQRAAQARAMAQAAQQAHAAALQAQVYHQAQQAAAQQAHTDALAAFQTVAQQRAVLDVRLPA